MSTGTGIAEKIIKEKILNSIQSCGLSHRNLDVPVVESMFGEFDFQSPLFFKIKDKNQIDSIVAHLKSDNLFEDVALTGKGFLSLKLNLEKYFNEFTKHFGELEFKNKKVLVDYCGVNVAKEMHIGHIRSMFIGDYIVRSHLAVNDEVVIQNHIGDWGSQFGFLLGYIIKNDIDVQSNKQLTEIYKKATDLYKSDEVFKDYAHSITAKLNQGETEVVQLWKTCVDLSMKSAEGFFDKFNLNISLNDTCGESFYKNMVSGVVDDLINMKIAKQMDDGSVVVFFENDKYSPMVLKKSTGAYLYGAYDLAAIQYRMNYYKPEKIVYVVDKRQELHFKQIFEIAVNANWCQYENLVHVGFGAILGQDKKPIKTRSGESLYLDDLLSTGFDIYNSNSKIAKDNGLNHKDINMISDKTVVGALKYYDLHMGYKEDYVFDWKDVLNTQGNSAPYLQNAFVRIDSILFKLSDNELESLNISGQHADKSFKMKDIDQLMSNLKIDNIKFNELTQSSKELMSSTISVFDELSLQSQTYSSNKLSQKLIKCAKAFHVFYENNKVVGSDKEEDLKKIIKYCAYALYYGMSNLGLDVYPCVDRLKNMKTNQPKI